MIRLLFFISAIIIVDCSDKRAVTILRDYGVVHVVNPNTCSREDARWWANDFESCFRSRKYKNSQDLFNIVVRLLDHSKICIKFATRECRPNYDGFVHIMDKVIKMIKEYFNMHVKLLINTGFIAYSGRDKIKDLHCVENSLTKDVYATCFSDVMSTYEQLLAENVTYDLIFHKEIEKAILCTNKVIKQCCKHVKIDINKVVRYILGVRQPDQHDIENDPTAYEPSKFTERPMLSSELRKTLKESIDDNSVDENSTLKESTDDNPEIAKLRDSMEILNSTEFSVTGREKIEVNFKFTNSTESSKPLKEKNDDDHNIRNFEISLNSTETPIFTKLTTFKTLPNSEKESFGNDTKLPEDVELTEHHKSLESSKSFLFSRIESDSNSTELSTSTSNSRATSPNPDGLINYKAFGTSKGTVAEETGEDTHILDWEDQEYLELTETPVPLKLPISTEHLKTLKPYKSSVFPRKDSYSNSTKLSTSTSNLKTTIFPKSEDLLNSTIFGTSKGTLSEETGEDTHVLDWEDEEELEFIETPVPSKLPISTEHVKTLKPYKSSVFPRKDSYPNFTKPSTSASNLKAMISPKPEDLLNSTIFGTSKGTLAEETGEDIHVLDWEGKEDLELTETPVPSKLPISTEHPKTLEPSKFSVFPRKDSYSNSTKLSTSTSNLKAIISPKPEDFLNSTIFGTSKSTLVEKTGEDTHILNWEDQKDLELTETPVLLKLPISTEHPKTLEPSKFSVFRKKASDLNSTELSTSTSNLKVMISPKPEDLLNHKTFGISKVPLFEETGKDTYIFDWQDQRDLDLTETPVFLKPRMSTGSSKILDSLKSSVFPNLRRKGNDSHSTKFHPFTSTLKTTIAQKPKDLPKSAIFGTSKGTLLFAETGEDTDKFDWVAKSTKLPKNATSTKSPKPAHHPKTTSSTKPSKSTRRSKTTRPSKPPKSSRRLWITKSAKSSKSARRSKTTKSTKPSKSTRRSKSTKAPKSIRRLWTTRSTKSSTVTQKTTSPKPTKDFGAVYSRTRDTYYERPRPTRRWYDFIVQPFANLWGIIKSWFGF